MVEGIKFSTEGSGLKLQTFLTVITVITITSGLISLYYAFTWRKKPGIQGKILQARMNITIGIALMGLGTNQFFFNDMVTMRIIFAVIFLLMGLVNLILGIRNQKYFKKLSKENS